MCERGESAFGLGREPQISPLRACGAPVETTILWLSPIAVGRKVNAPSINEPPLPSVSAVQNTPPTIRIFKRNTLVFPVRIFRFYWALPMRLHTSHGRLVHLRVGE